MSEPRNGEMTAVLNREMFDRLPGGVTSEQDKERWLAFRVAYHRAQRLLDFTEFPLQIDFGLNETCQMKCAFCVHGDGKVHNRRLSFGLFKRVINEGEDHGLCSVKLNHNNEPLLTRDLPRYIRYAKDHGVLNVYIATNGLLLNRTMARQLIEAGLSKVMVSLDATTSETFEAIRRSDRLDDIVSNVHGLLELRRELGVDYPLVRVNFLRTKENAHEAEDFVRRWTGVADMIGFQNQLGRPGIIDDLLSPEDGEQGRFRCAMPFKLLAVVSSGEILPCCPFSGYEMPLGNIEVMTIKEAWDSEQLRVLKLLHQSGEGMTNPVCAHCVGS